MMYQYSGDFAVYWLHMHTPWHGQFDMTCFVLGAKHALCLLVYVWCSRVNRSNMCQAFFRIGCVGVGHGQACHCLDSGENVQGLEMPLIRAVTGILKRLHHVGSLQMNMTWCITSP